MAESPPATSRARRMWALAVVGIVTAASLVFYGWQASIPEGFVVDLLALDEGTAVVVLRRNEDSGPPQYWLVALGSEGDPTGWVALDMEIETATGSPTLARVGDAIAVRGIAGGRDVVAAYSLDGFTPRWGTDLGAADDESVPDLGLYAAGDLLIATLHAADGSVVAAIEPGDGTVRWEAALPVEVRGVAAPLVAGPWIVLVAAPSVIAIDSVTGVVVRTLRLGWLACVSEGGALAAMAEDGLTEIGADPAADRVVLSRAEVGALVPGASGAGAAHRCGTRDGRYVMTPLSSEWSGLVGVDPAHARPPFALPLPAMREVTIVQGRVGWRFPGRTPLTGTLTRFVPVVVERVLDVEEPDVLSPYFLAIADLDEPRIASLSPGSPWLLHFSIATVDGRHYVADSDEIALLDGATGEIVAAIQVEGWTRDWLRPDAIAGGRAWLVGGGWARVDALPVAIVDAATLAPIVVRGEITVRDHLAEARALLIGPVP